MFPIEKDLEPRIKDSRKERDLDMAKSLIRYMFSQNEKNLIDLGRNREPIAGLITGKSEKQIAEIMLEKITSRYGYSSIKSHFLSLLQKQRNVGYLYLHDKIVEKTSDNSEQQLSIRSWFF